MLLTLRDERELTVLFEQTLGTKTRKNNRNGHKQNTFTIQRTWTGENYLNLTDDDFIWEYFFDHEKLYVNVGGMPFVYHLLEYSIEENSYEYCEMRQNLKRAAGQVQEVEKPVKRVKLNNLTEGITLLEADCDFVVKSQDESFSVHSLVMKAYWPYFRSIQENNCLENNTSTLELDFPANWVQKLVLYIYGKPFDADFDELTGLLHIGEFYQLPGLVELATRKILESFGKLLSLEDMIKGWKRASEANNKVIKGYLMNLMLTKIREGGKMDLKELFQGFETHEMLELFEGAVGVC